MVFIFASLIFLCAKPTRKGSFRNIMRVEGKGSANTYWLDGWSCVLFLSSFFASFWIFEERGSVSTFGSWVVEGRTFPLLSIIALTLAYFGWEASLRFLSSLLTTIANCVPSRFKKFFTLEHWSSFEVTSFLSRL